MSEIAPEEKIRGWKNLCVYTKLCEHTIRRGIHYGTFPKPIGMERRGSACSHVWDKQAVSDWLKWRVKCS